MKYCVKIFYIYVIRQKALSYIFFFILSFSVEKKKTVISAVASSVVCI